MPQRKAIRDDAGAGLQTELLRLTVFLLAPQQSAPQKFAEPTWWTDLTEAQPETKTARPARGELEAAGTFGDRTLVLSVQPGRVDWYFAPRAENADPSTLRLAGPFAETLDIFFRLMTKWLEICPAVVRLAFGAVLLEPVPDRAAGYRRLSEYLPAVDLDPDGSQDFLYQINRPRSSSVVEKLGINRLSKWSSAMFFPIRLNLEPQAIQPYVGEKAHACRIDLDISTAAEYASELPRAKLPEIFKELKDFAVEIAAQGDIA